MYPNPQAALPLPERPRIDHYRKRAKDLVKACRSADPDAIRAWAMSWISAVLRVEKAQRKRWPQPADVDGQALEVAEYANSRLAKVSGTCTLSNAQFVIARAYGFTSWPKFAAHVESLERSGSRVSAFEAAVDAVVAGKIATLRRLLQEHPALTRARSTREHRGTLLIYTSANGVEGYRQRSPKNAAAVAELLLESGAEVDATAAVYGSECTTLGLVATSAPPDIAGVQLEVIDVLLRHGARMDPPGLGGHTDSVIRSCLANGQPRAAAYLASRGAPLDLSGAAGIGRVDVLDRLLAAHDGRAQRTPSQLADAFAIACAYGQLESVRSFLDHGTDVNTELRFHGEGHLGLHVAAFHGHTEVVQLLLARGASVDAIDQTWRTPPLKWALAGWGETSHYRDARYYDVVTRLVGAGAQVPSDVLAWDNVRRDPKMIAALQGRNEA